MVKKLIISPQAGLGNRLRVMAGARYIAKELGRELYHYWVRDDRRSKVNHVNDMKDSGFDYFFRGIEEWRGGYADVCYTEWMNGDYWYYEQSTGQSKLSVSTIRRQVGIEELKKDDSEVMLLEVSDLGLGDKVLVSGYRGLDLSDCWKGVLDNLVRYDYGIAIRRGNFLGYHPEEDIGLEEMERRLSVYGGSKVIFSDDIGYRDELRRRVGCMGDVGGEGLENYWLQFLLLSRSGCVLGTRGSSFGKQAALFGGVRYRDI